MGGHPKNIVLLTCDAQGVMPPIAKLSPDQALYHFISGYTSKVGGTEVGLGDEPEITFSTCFGAPFMVHHPMVYADLLKRKIVRYEANCWLLNTGWVGGPYGVGKPKEYVAYEPGDIVQLDTLDLRPLPGVVLKQFTARDSLSRWDVVEVHQRATARTAAGFLDALQTRMPFAVGAVQALPLRAQARRVDGGSEFMAQFEEACRQRQIELFVVPPRSPKPSG